MARRTANKNYPDDYGVVLGKVLPNILTPLKIDQEGDKLVPPNDMAEVAGALCAGGELKDPLGLVYSISKDGTKGGM
jgi:hypothetical protein